MLEARAVITFGSRTMTSEREDRGLVAAADAVVGSGLTSCMGRAL